MSKSLPTVQQIDDYYTQLGHNNEKMQQLLEQLFPNAGVPYDAIFQIIDFIRETHVNAQILPRVIRGVHNLNVGTGKGQVIIHVRNESANVEIREQDDDVSTKLK